MSILLSRETQKLLEQRILSGNYASADEVVHAALEALDTLHSHVLDEATLEAIDRAEDQIEQGHLHEWNDVRERLRADVHDK